MRVVLPEDPEIFPACPFGGENKLSTDAQNTMADWALGDATHEAHWVVNPHTAIPGRTPLEHWTPGTPEPIK